MIDPDDCLTHARPVGGSDSWRGPSLTHHDAVVGEGHVGGVHQILDQRVGSEPKTQNPKPKIQKFKNPEPRTQNPKPKTPNPKP